jgi:hypothetical protein
VRAVEFTINIETGEFTMLVEGIVGPACEEVAKLVKDMAGEPGRDQATGEYQLRPRVRTRAENRLHARRG